MKRIIAISILSLIVLASIGQITTASYTNKGVTTPFINSSLYKLNGVQIYDTSNVSRNYAFITKYQYYRLNFFTLSNNNFGIGMTPTSKLSVNGTGYFNLPDATSSAFRIGINTADDVLLIHSNTKQIVFDGAEMGYKVGIRTTPTQPLDVNGIIRSTSYIMQLGIYAGIYVSDASTAQSIANGTTYIKSTAFTTNGLSANCTSDATNDKITITKTGKYLINGTCSFSSGTNNTIWRSAAFLGGVEQSNIHWSRKVGTAGDVGSASFMGLINVTSVPVDLDVRFRHDQPGAINITVEYSNLTVVYIGE